MPVIAVQFTTYGPLIETTFSPTSIRMDVMRRQGKPTPRPLDALALIDTGSDCTLVSPSITKTLGLAYRDVVQVRAIGDRGQPVARPAFDADMRIASHSMRYTLPVVEESSLLTLPFDAVIGRDILQYCVLNYNGPDETASLSF